VLPSESESDACECDAAVLARVVSEAHALGLSVATHAQGGAAIERALAAGVDSIEHGGLASRVSPRAAPSSCRPSRASTG
jgi:imidazolonepropionase-like amidohydrolase